MPIKRTIALPLLIFGTLPLCGHTAETQISIGVESNHFVEGLNLTDDNPALNLAIDVSFDHGTFFGGDCYRANVDRGAGLKSGCDYYLGYFKPLSKNQALTLSATHHDYQRTSGRQWDYTELSVEWHVSRKATLSVSATDDWFGRGFETVSLNGKFEYPLSASLSTILEGGIVNLESRAPIDSLEFGKLSLQHQHKRWTSKLSVIASDNDLRRMTRFDVDQPEIALSISYRLY